jgi:hypothetical protein
MSALKCYCLSDRHGCLALGVGAYQIRLAAERGAIIPSRHSDVYSDNTAILLVVSHELQWKFIPQYALN